jgi:hypothetical protein
VETSIQLAFFKQLENVIIEDFIAKRKPEYNWPSVSNKEGQLYAGFL